MTASHCLRSLHRLTHRSICIRASLYASRSTWRTYTSDSGTPGSKIEAGHPSGPSVNDKINLKPLTNSKSASSSILPVSASVPESASALLAQPLPKDAETLRQNLISRPPQKSYDYLVPTPSHLLNLQLSSFLPWTCFQPPFVPSNPNPYSLPEVTTPPSSQGVGHNVHPLPEAHHLVYFPLQIPPDQLLPDGTDPHQCPSPEFTRRVWAGGSVTWNLAHPLLIQNQRVVCTETIADAAIQGTLGSGTEKVLVDVRRQYSDADSPAPAITELRRLAFMRAQETNTDFLPLGADRALKPPPGAPDLALSLTPSRALLTHYSALSYNAHLIHLDPGHTRAAEGHRDLLVHGPLTLTLLLAVLRAVLAQGERVRSVEYRNLVPLYVGESMRLCVRRKGGAPAGGGGRRDAVRRWDVWIEGPTGGLHVKATAVTEALEE